MPRTARASHGGYCYHVLNRGNDRNSVFHKDGDFDAFVTLLKQAQERTPIRLLAYCLMPNHFHLAVWPLNDNDLSEFMMWLMTAYVRRYHRHYHSSGRGHVWQGRFKAFPIETDDHLLRVLRYIERNPLRAKLVELVQDWRWSSASPRLGSEPLLDLGPVPRGPQWLEYVNSPQSDAEVKALQECIRRGRPYGGESWTKETAIRLGLESSLRPQGRPKKEPPSLPSLFGDDP